MADGQRADPDILEHHGGTVGPLIGAPGHTTTRLFLGEVRDSMRHAKLAGRPTTRLEALL
jgi:hypothetical protein